MLEIELIQEQNVAMKLFSVSMERLRKLPDDASIRIFLTPEALENLLQFEPRDFMFFEQEFAGLNFTQMVQHIKLFSYLEFWIKPPESREWPLYQIIGICLGANEKKTFFGTESLEKVLIFDLKA